MAIKRRRLSCAFAAAAIIILWWQYGPSPGPTTRLFADNDYDSKFDVEVGSGRTELSNAKPREISKFKENTDPVKSRETYPLSTYTALPSGSSATISPIQFLFLREDAEVSQVQIMGFEKEFHEAAHAAATMDFRTPTSLPINVFETTIRLPGSFLGAYDVSGSNYPILLEKAQEIGEMLYGAFITPNRLPITRWSKLDGGVASGDTAVPEIGSLPLEFTRLSQLTGDPNYFDAVQGMTNFLSDQQMRTKLPGLFPMIVNAREADFTSTTIFTIGGMADSLYEYFPKEYLMLGGRLDQYRSLNENAFAAIKEFIFLKPMTPTHGDIVLAGNVRAFNPFEL